ncbi:MAG: protoheme IX farnesyltransferase [Acidobacteria bacterium]|nr:heme o synthase [Acidobacteriota bacterium]MCB9397718.1 protoheme IX farnesyltransferase [Acidobacteriota bacterium]
MRLAGWLGKASGLWELTKPRALVVIIFTSCLGFILAEPDQVRWLRMTMLGFGVGLAGAGSLALNQYFERHKDALMERTRQRPLPSGRVSALSAFLFGWLLMGAGYAYLWLWVNPYSSLVTVLCGVSYLAWYTPLKYKTSLSSFVGAIPGAVLPVMGWVASRDQMELGAWILFGILFIWQIPHALIIAIRYREDYARAGMKQLPVVANDFVGTRQILLNLIILIPLSVMPSLTDMAGFYYGTYALATGFSLLVLGIRYAFRPSEGRARAFFIALSVYLPLLLLVMVLDKPGI